MRKPKYSQSLCWICANAVPNADGTRGCSWSQELKPVEGWEAEKVYNSNVARVARPDFSYKVIKCPEFENDPTFTDLDKPICEQRSEHK